jgi:pimeloyl-ACP methyl ester carboxylesterase
VVSKGVIELTKKRNMPLILIVLLLLTAFIACQKQNLTGYAVSEEIRDDENKFYGTKLSDEPGFETHFAGIEKTDALRIIFYHDSESSQPVWIEGDVSYELSKTAADPYENITLTVVLFDGIVPKFKLHIGASSETFEFGKEIPDVVFDGSYSLVDRDDALIDVELAKVDASAVIKGTDESSIVAKVDSIATPVLGTDVFACDDIAMEEAQITLPKEGDVNAILECSDFDVINFACLGSWHYAGIPFTDNGTHITFIVNHFSGYGGGLVVISVQSYPMLNENWPVAFNTTGTANLTITGINGTDFTTDLEFVRLKCGDAILNATYDNTSIFYSDYSCNETSYEVSKVLTIGKHILKFEFGNSTAYAYNTVYSGLNNISSVANATFIGESTGGSADAPALGDINNDSNKDLIIGADGFDKPGFPDAGKTYLFYTPLIKNMTYNLSSANASWTGDKAGDFSGEAVASGDVNTDGFADILIGAPGADDALNTTLDVGKTYLIYGRAGLAGNFDLGLVTDYNSSFEGIIQEEEAGSALAVGDLNNDSYADIAIGAPGNFSIYTMTGEFITGSVYVFFGPIGTAYNASQANATLKGNNTTSGFGTSITIGDINNDGFNDLIVGAANDTLGGSNEGAAYAFFGPLAQGTVKNASNANVSWYGEGAGDLAGFSLSSGKDANNDSIHDLLIGAPLFDTGPHSDEGKIYLIYGSPALSGVISLSNANFSRDGESSGDWAGFSVALGDEDNNTMADVLAGAPRQDYGGNNAGRIYLFYSPLDPGNDNINTANASFYGSTATQWLGTAVTIGSPFVGCGSEEEERGICFSLNLPIAPEPPTPEPPKHGGGGGSKGGTPLVRPFPPWTCEVDYDQIKRTIRVMLTSKTDTSSGLHFRKNGIPQEPVIAAFVGTLMPGTILAELPADEYFKPEIDFFLTDTSWKPPRYAICNVSYPPAPRCEFIAEERKFYFSVTDYSKPEVQIGLEDAEGRSVMVGAGTEIRNDIGLFNIGKTINLNDYGAFIQTNKPIIWTIYDPKKKEIIDENCSGESPRPSERCILCVPFTPPFFPEPEQPEEPSYSQVPGYGFNLSFCPPPTEIPGPIPPIPPFPRPKPSPPPGVPPKPVPPSKIPPPPDVPPPRITKDLPAEFNQISENINYVPCANPTWQRSDLQLAAFETESEVAVPLGYELIRGPFGFNCNKDDVSVTLNIPETCEPNSVRAYRCSQGKCKILPETHVSDDLVCDGVPMSVYRARDQTYRRDAVPLSELEPIPFAAQVITESASFVWSSRYRIDFVSNIPTGLVVSISGPHSDVPLPLNPSLGFMGTPMLAFFNGTVPRGTGIKVVMPYTLEPGYDEKSLGIYVRYKGRWISLASTVDLQGGLVYALVPDITEFLENNSVLFAIVGIKCSACTASSFERVYNPGTRDAIVLVHGMTSSSATWQPLVDDYMLNNQPWQIWALDYPSYLPVDEVAKDLADSLQMHNAEYDNIYLAGHSLGGFVVQRALEIADSNRMKYTFLGKVKKVILPGQPGKGSPALDVYKKLFADLINSKTISKAFDLNSAVIADLRNGRQYKRIPGIEYYVIAGTQPYRFNLGFFTVTTAALLNLTLPNDGIMTTESAQYVGYTYVNNACNNYFEIDLTHTELIDDKVPRRIIERIISKEQALENPGAAYVGYNQYATLGIDACTADEGFVVVCKQMPAGMAKAPLNCNCGNGICGEGENNVNCPADCFGAWYSIEGMCIAVPIFALFFSVLLAAFTIIYLVRKRVQKKPVGKMWKLVLIALLVIVILIILLMLFQLYVCDEIPAFNLILLIINGIVLIIDALVPFRPKEKNAEADLSTWRTKK